MITAIYPEPYTPIILAIPWESNHIGITALLCLDVVLSSNIILLQM